MFSFLQEGLINKSLPGTVIMVAIQRNSAMLGQLNRPGVGPSMSTILLKGRSKAEASCALESCREGLVLWICPN